MSRRTDEQLSFDDLGAGAELAWSDEDTIRATQYLGDVAAAVSIEHLAVARFSLDEATKRQARAALDSRRAETILGVWRRRRADYRRKAAPRPTIPASVRDAVMADAGGRCWQSKVDGCEQSLQLGHILSVRDAWDLVEVLGDSAPWRIANQPENLFAQCERCNLGQGARSRTAQLAGAILMRPRGDTMPLRWEVAAEVVRHCRIVEQLEAGREPKP